MAENIQTQIARKCLIFSEIQQFKYHMSQRNIIQQIRKYFELYHIKCYIAKLIE